MPQLKPFLEELSNDSSINKILKLSLIDVAHVNAECCDVLRHNKMKCAKIAVAKLETCSAVDLILAGGTRFCAMHLAQLKVRAFKENFIVQEESGR